jgi:diguanylate cyclase
MRCDLAQGYLVARPATVEELIAILGDERRLRFYQQTAASGAAGPQQVETTPKSA